MQSKSLAALCALALICLFVPSYAKADSVPVVNADFSQLGALLSISCGADCAYNNVTPTGWSYSGTANGGSWQPNSSFYTSLPPSETTVAFINGGVLTQDVGALLADTTYTLTVYVGNRLDKLTTNYSFGLEGSTGLATWSNNGLITPGTFVPETISFTTGSNVTGDLTIFLQDAGPQADFGDVSLTAVAAPESSSLTLLAIGLLGLFGLAKRYGFKPATQLNSVC